MRLLNSLNPFGIGSLKCILSAKIKIYNKNHATKRIVFTKKTKRYIVTIKLNSKLSLHLDCWFLPKTLPSHILTIHHSAKHFINLYSSASENYIFSIAKLLLIRSYIADLKLHSRLESYKLHTLYYLTKCEQMFPRAKLFSKKVDISKFRKDKIFKFSPLAKN